MTMIDSEVQFSEFVDFSSPIDFSSAWQVGVSDDIGTVIHKQEAEVDGCHYDLPLSTSNSAATPVNYPSMTTPLMNQKRTFTDILRKVKVAEDTLQCAVARLGGGTQGLQLLMDYINYWALESQDGDVTAAITRGIVGLGMTPLPLPLPRQRCNSRISINSNDGIHGDPSFDSISRAMFHIGNHGAAYTRALRKSQMLRQRSQTKVRHPSTSKNGSQSQKWRQSARHQWSQDKEINLNDSKKEGYAFLFQKVLRASDVSSLGRIVLPKKDAERYFPFLIAKEGFMIPLEDYDCGKFWTARYRYWPNNKSQMYVLENIGDFVRFHCLKDRDLLLCYRNDRGGYVIRGQKVPAGSKNPARGLIARGAEASETASASETELAAAAMPAARQFVEGECACGTYKEDVANTFSDSSTFTSGETSDARRIEDGCGRDQGGFCEQAGYPACGGEVLANGFLASDKPLVQDWI